MASRESQGLQIALILFVLITIALIGSTIFFYRIAESSKAEAQSARESLTAKNVAFDKATSTADALKSMIGYGQVDLAKYEGLVDDQTKTIITNFRDDMKMYGVGLTEENHNYRSLPPSMEKAIRDRTQMHLEQVTRADTAHGERDAIEKREIARADSAESTQQRDAKAYETERQQLVAYRQQVTSDKEKLIRDVAQSAETARQTEQKLTTEATTLNKEIVRVNKLLEGARLRFQEVVEESFEGPDGRVSMVNQRQGIVWISLGLADGLRRQTTFSVYDRDDGGVMKVENKGSIEVTKILDQHLAEARITNDSLRDPILPGDLIHSPAFRPGRKVTFAIAGFIDIDGDGSSDRNLLRNLITMSGGVIDAEVHDDGQITGALTSTTRFLIRGAQPTEKTGQGARQGYTTMFREAKELSIEDMTLDEFLSFVGWKGEVRTVPLGRNARSEDFKAKPADGVVRRSSGTTSGVFRKRNPPTRGNNGAYK